jgi:tRNA-specific 2-thiouridylase
VDEYASGRTPNPCVQCNNWIKFGKLFDYADSVGADYVATGHYARLRQSAGGKIDLCRGQDNGKDQSYVLFGVKREQLARMMLPVGDYEKPQIRRLAAELGMRVADKQDSQEICFVSEGRYDAFLRARREHLDTSGELVTVDGTVVGKHGGIEGFTVGQRKGLGVALGEPKFVVRIDPETRRVVIGDRHELMHRELTARQVIWHETTPVNKVKHCYAQIRYNAKAARAMVRCLPNERLQIEFDEPQFGIAPGQAVVCYDPESNQRVLAGGWIE